MKYLKKNLENKKNENKIILSYKTTANFALIVKHKTLVANFVYKCITKNPGKISHRSDTCFNCFSPNHTFFLV